MDLLPNQTASEDRIHRNWSVEVVFSSGLILHVYTTFDDLKKFLERKRKPDSNEKIKPVEKWVMAIAFERAIKFFPNHKIARMTLSKVK